MGPPGSGKGTQASQLAKKLGMGSVSSGDLFRDHRRRETQLGKLVKSYMDRGDYVPDDVTIRMVIDWIHEPLHVNGFVLDGFPRTQLQAKALDEALSGGEGIDRVLFIGVSESELIRRLTGRLVCRKCQTPYHLHSSPPRRESVCDDCGGELYQREDDIAEVVTNRIQIYSRETKPVVDYYRASGKLREVDGEAPIQAVAASLLTAVSH